MLCQRCKKNNANTVFTQTINGHTTTEHICSACAKEAMEQNASAVNSFFEDFPFSSFMASPRISSNKRCAGCGMSFDEIMEIGKLGCAECYSVFSEELSPTIQSIHGRANHIGKRPKRLTKELPAANEAASEIDVLRQKLQAAVDEQNYEDAAKYRDEIKRLTERA